MLMMSWFESPSAESFVVSSVTTVTPGAVQAGPGVPAGVAVGVGVATGVAVGVTVAVAVGVGVAVGVAVGVGVGVGVGPVGLLTMISWTLLLAV